MGLTPVVRLNGTSDLPWHRMPFRVENRTYACVMDAFPSVRFYDYTKDPRRMRETLPRNYDLTFSRSESNDSDVARVLADGKRVAVVFRGGLPRAWRGFPVVVGDETDLRFLDAGGVFVGLTAKGRAKRDATGFVVDTAQRARFIGECPGLHHGETCSLHEQEDGSFGACNWGFRHGDA